MHKEPLKTFASDLSRELTEKEKEQMQRRDDLMLAKDLFGVLLVVFPSNDVFIRFGRWKFQFLPKLFFLFYFKGDSIVNLMSRIFVSGLT